MTAAIDIRGVSKKFRIKDETSGSLRAAIVDRLRGTWATADFWALRDINLAIAPGETVAIIGANGSGKSTLLKLMARILEPTSGQVTINGSLFALLELGASFQQDYTGRENIFLFGSYHGLSRKDVEARYDEIVAFAELGDFIGQPVKYYSSGMYLRLAMSTATVFDPDILVVDELLAVGDARFQQKCMRRFEQLKAQGRTIVLVTHALGLAEQVCDRVILLERGVVQADGPPAEVIGEYARRVNAPPAQVAAEPRPTPVAA